MQFIKHDLGERRGGDIVEVDLSRSAFVRLMDSANFWKYRSGQMFDFTGGYIESSPWRVEIPRSGHWVIAVDLAGYAGRVGSSFRIQTREPAYLEPASAP